MSIYVDVEYKGCAESSFASNSLNEKGSGLYSAVQNVRSYGNRLNAFLALLPLSLSLSTYTRDMKIICLQLTRVDSLFTRSHRRCVGVARAVRLLSYSETPYSVVNISVLLKYTRRNLILSERISQRKIRSGGELKRRVSRGALAARLPRKLRARDCRPRSSIFAAEASSAARLPSVGRDCRRFSRLPPCSRSPRRCSNCSRSRCTRSSSCCRSPSPSPCRFARYFPGRTIRY